MPRMQRTIARTITVIRMANTNSFGHTHYTGSVTARKRKLAE
jgi:hypothetical protein